jgi:hypothetical protein
LNLHALLGAQRADVGSVRAIWVVQDRLALDADEENALELKREMVSGQERVVWNPALSIPAREFELVEAEVCRLKAALATWDSYAAGVDRRWLEPLIGALFAATTTERIGGTIPHMRRPDMMVYAPTQVLRVSSQYKVTASQRQAEGGRLDYDLTVSGPHFPIILGCSFRIKGQVVDVPHRVISDPGLYYVEVLWPEEAVLPARPGDGGVSSSGEILFALWANDAFTTRCCDTGWMEWRGWTRMPF